MQTQIQELSPYTQKRLHLLKEKMNAEDVDDAANTAIDFLYTLIELGGEAHLVNDKTGRGYHVSLK